MTSKFMTAIIFAIVVSVSPAHATSEDYGSNAQARQNNDADTSIVLRKPGEVALPARQASPRNLQRWARRIGQQYPMVSLFLEQYGRTRFVTRVTQRGRATDCRVVQSSGFSYLDRRTCMAIERYGRFLAEQDDAGNPIEASYTNTISWALPDTDAGDFWFDSLGLTYPVKALEAGLEGTTQIEIVVGVDERPNSCKVLASSGHSTLDKATCAGILELDGGDRVAKAYTGAETRTLRRNVKWEIEEEDADEGY